MSSTREESLEGLRVLGIGSGVATRIAASWLAASGAEVAIHRPKWERPAVGSAEATFERQVSRATGGIDLDRAANYDVVIGEHLDLDDVPEVLLEGAVIVDITSPLGAAESFDHALVNDMILWARSGLGYLTREIDAEWQLSLPCLPVNRQASILAGIAAATAAVAAVLENPHPERPTRRISIDQLELLALMPMQPVAFAQLADRIVGREQRAGLGGTVPTADGLAYVGAVEPAHWARLLRLVGGLDWAADQVEENPAILREARAEIDRRIRDWALGLSSEEVADRCQAEHVPGVPVYRPDQVVGDPHLAARGFFMNGEHAEKPAGGGLNLPWLASVGGAAGTAAGNDVDSRAGGRVRPRAGSRDEELPLAGLRILDLSWAWAGPFATTLLADLGAEVVNVEWYPRASNLRRNAPFAENRADSHNTAAWWSANQRGKLSIGVDMKTPEGRDVVRDLAARSDVVVENFSPGVVHRLGVDFENLVQANPRLVYVSLSAFGQTGPRSHYVGYGTQVYASAGACYATSQDGRTLSQMYIPFPDPVSGLAGAFAIAAFVSHARTTGRPARVDLSEQEAMAMVVLEPLLDALEKREGKRDDAPSTTDSFTRRYVVVGTADSRFVALLARAPNDWLDFQRALGASGNSTDELRAAARPFTAAALLDRVAALGLVAAPLQDSGEILQDPYLIERDFWVPDLSPEVAASGACIAGSPWHLDGERSSIWRGAPRLFADTRNVLERILDYAPDAIDALMEKGAVV